MTFDIKISLKGGRKKPLVVGSESPAGSRRPTTGQVILGWQTAAIVLPAVLTVSLMVKDITFRTTIQQGQLLPIVISAAFGAMILEFDRAVTSAKELMMPIVHLITGILCLIWFIGAQTSSDGVVTTLLTETQQNRTMLVLASVFLSTGYSIRKFYSRG